MLAIMLAVLLSLLQGGDWWTTRRAIASGQAGEGNAIIAWVIAKLGFNGAFIAMGLIVALVAMGMTQVTGGVWVLGAGVLLYCWVLWHNYTLVKP